MAENGGSGRITEIITAVNEGVKAFADRVQESPLGDAFEGVADVVQVAKAAIIAVVVIFALLFLAVLGILVATSLTATATYGGGGKFAALAAAEKK
jgi:hypothetical protein